MESIILFVLLAIAPTGEVGVGAYQDMDACNTKRQELVAKMPQAKISLCTPMTFTQSRA